MDLDESLLSLFGDEDEPDALRTVDTELWKEMQERTFAAWCNSRLKARGMSIENRLADDLSDGVLLINLLEILSERRVVERYNRTPKNKFQMLENCRLCLDFMRKEGVKLVGIIGPNNVVEGAKNPRLILGLVWKIIRHYQIDKQVEVKAAVAEEKPSHPLLAWVRSKIPEKNVRNFASDWRSGINVAALVDAIQPGLCPEHATMDDSTPVENARLAMNRAHAYLGVPMVLDPQDLVSKSNNVHCVMTYVSCLRDAKAMTDFKAFIDHRASVATARKYHNSGAVEVMHAVLCSQDCDLDSMVSSIAHSYFNEQANLKFNQASSVLIPLFNQRRADVIFCTEATYLFGECNVDSTRVACIDDVNLTSLQAQGRLKLTLVNHNELSPPQRHLVPDVVEILDHHDDRTEGVYESTLPIWIDPDVGCTATLIAECYLDQMPHLLEKNPEIVVLLLGAILYTTDNLTSPTTCERDHDAAERLGGRTSVDRDALYTELAQRSPGPRLTRASAYDVLRFDFKRADDAPGGVHSGGSVLVREHLDEFLARPDASEAIDRVSKENDLALFALVSHCFDGDRVRCQVGVSGSDGKLVSDAVEYLRTRDDIQLSSVDEAEPCGLKVFRLEVSSGSGSERDAVLSHIVDFLKNPKPVSVSPPPNPHNVMWLSGHHDGFPVVVCAACYLPERSVADYGTEMSQVYKFCIRFIKDLRCEKFIAVYLYGGTSGMNVEKYRWMRQWYFYFTKKFEKKVQSVYLLHCGAWTERLLKLTGLFMNRNLYEKLTFASTIEELSQFLDVHQINFPQSVLREDEEISEKT